MSHPRIDRANLPAYAWAIVILLLAAFGAIAIAHAADAPKPVPPVLTTEQKLRLTKLQLRFMQLQQQVSALPGYAELLAQENATQREFNQAGMSMCPSPAGDTQRYVLTQMGADDWQCQAQPTGPANPPTPPTPPKETK